jgi:hypothetical protein
MRQDCKSNFCSSVKAAAAGVYQKKADTKPTNTSKLTQNAFLTMITDGD